MTSLPITIPSGYTITVASGDSIKAGQLLANPPQHMLQEKLPDDYKIDIASIYVTKPSRAGKFLKKEPGELVGYGDIIAQRKSVFGLKSEEVVAKIPGTMVKYDRESGSVVIRKSEQSSSIQIINQQDPIIAPMTGKITSLSDNEIVIEGKTDALLGIKGIGGRVNGLLQVVTTEDHDPVESLAIVKEMTGKILLVSGMTRDALVKASAIGVVGVIGLSIVQEDLDYLEHKKIDITVIDVDKALWKKLKEKDGKTVILDGLEKSILLS